MSGTEYAGATGRLALERAGALGPRWALQPKIDGCYARVHLDARGRIEHVYSRTGRPLERSLIGHLIGVRIGWPHSQLVGELEAHTESGNAAAERRGARALHLFDAIRSGREYLARAPYAARRDALWRMQSEACNLSPEQPWARDRNRGRERESGRYCRAVPTEWRLTPIVPQRPAAEADAAWAEWGVDAGGEGLVAVNLAAPLGARSSKRKVKIATTLECRVVGLGEKSISVEYGGRIFSVSAAAERDEHELGEIVEVACDGWYSTADIPRFVRLVRARPDLQ
jgi:hypothetical protein